jgi:hypothetical protein
MNESAARLAALEPRCSTDEALGLFDGLPTVAIDELTGRWRGRELATGHPWDGLLSASGWYGKQFDGPESVHPLLFRTPRGTLFPLDPGRIPLSLVGHVPVTAVSAGRRLLDGIMPLLRARGPKARLRNVEHRGKVSAAMIYDQLPIIDVFRRVDATTLLGVMDQRNARQPYFFVLTRD